MPDYKLDLKDYSMGSSRPARHTEVVSIPDQSLLLVGSSERPLQIQLDDAALVDTSLKPTEKLDGIVLGPDDYVRLPARSGKVLGLEGHAMAEAFVMDLSDHADAGRCFGVGAELLLMAEDGILQVARFPGAACNWIQGARSLGDYCAWQPLDRIVTGYKPGGDGYLEVALDEMIFRETENKPVAFAKTVRLKGPFRDDADVLLKPYGRIVGAKLPCKIQRNGASYCLALTFDCAGEQRRVLFDAPASDPFIRDALQYALANANGHRPEIARVCKAYETRIKNM